MKNIVCPNCKGDSIKWCRYEGYNYDTIICEKCGNELYFDDENNKIYWDDVPDMQKETTYKANIVAYGDKQIIEIIYDDEIVDRILVKEIIFERIVKSRYSFDTGTIEEIKEVNNGQEKEKKY
jgi:transcription initiation factor TFIIIB Brf1 subunit/transcription initiation factor TFIIB